MLCMASTDISSLRKNINSTAVFPDYLSVSYDYASIQLQIQNWLVQVIGPKSKINYLGWLMTKHWVRQVSSLASIQNEAKYSRMNQLKFVETAFKKIEGNGLPKAYLFYSWAHIVCPK